MDWSVDIINLYSAPVDALNRLLFPANPVLERPSLADSCWRTLPAFLATMSLSERQKLLLHLRWFQAAAAKRVL